MRQFNVYLNGKWIDKIYGSKAEAKGWVKRNVLYTHMGEWLKIPMGFEYATSVGRYYTFVYEIVGGAE